MVVVVFANIFDAEDVDYKAERYCLSFLVPQVGRVFDGLVSVLGNVSGDLVMFKVSLLWHSIYTLESLFHDVPVFDFVKKAVCVDEVLCEQVDWDAKVLIVQEWCAEVNVFDINFKTLRYGGRYGTINEYL